MARRSSTHSKHLAIAEAVGDRAGAEGRAYGNLGNVHELLGEYGMTTAGAWRLQSRWGTGRGRARRTGTLLASGMHAEAVEQASRAVQVYAMVEREVGDGALRISLFAAEQVKSYLILQEALLASGRPGPALAVAELSKARVLSDAIGGESTSQAQDWRA
jgi:hypothetical protein